MKKIWIKRAIACAIAMSMVVSAIMCSSVSSSTTSAATKGKINTKKCTLTVGKTKKLKVTGINSNKKRKWSSSNKKVATVSNSGLVKARKKGTATIKVKVNQLSFRCKVTVKAKDSTTTSGTSLDERLVKNSLYHVGNNARYLKAVEKAQAGEDVNIAYLGGSITQGVGSSDSTQYSYASLATQKFADKYAVKDDQVQCINAGIAGTPSILGVQRCQHDVIDKNPDIVFIEFAVNDGTDSTYQAMYESLVRTILNSDSKPAVFLLFTVTSSGYSAQYHMKKIGTYYDLGMVSVRDAIWPEIEAGTMTFKGDYAQDDAHPNNTGHAMIASFIANLFDAEYVKEADSDYQVEDTPVISNEYESMKNVSDDSSLITSMGDFSAQDVNCFTYETGWVHDTSNLSDASANNPLTMKVTAKNILISFQQYNQSSVGCVDVYVDGEKVQTMETYLETGWGNCSTILIPYETTAEHTIEFKMSDGDENKSATILGVAYN